MEDDANASVLEYSGSGRRRQGGREERTNEGSRAEQSRQRSGAKGAREAKRKEGAYNHCGGGDLQPAGEAGTGQARGGEKKTAGRAERCVISLRFVAVAHAEERNASNVQQPPHERGNGRASTPQRAGERRVYHKCPSSLQSWTATPVSTLSYCAVPCTAPVAQRSHFTVCLYGTETATRNEGRFASAPL